MSENRRRLFGVLVTVQDQDRLSGIELLDCTIVGGPNVRFSVFEDVSFLNCTFLYDGMEVAGNEWLALMSYGRATLPVSPRRAPRSR